MADIWNHSGWLARGVIVMLVLMLLASIFTSIERLIAFNRARNQSMRVAAEVVKPMQQGDLAAALKVTEAPHLKASYLAALLRAGLRELVGRLDEHGLANAGAAVSKAHAEEMAKMRRGMTILATTGSTAPFVGLFGTTFGVINAFQGMATAGSGLAAISAGISEALITTGVGIGVAVIGVWFFNYFTFRAEKVGDELGSAEADFNGWAAKLLQAQQG
jgi:biopolymer transport protein ExbB/biopolymer transport protein TolQ